MKPNHTSGTIVLASRPAGAAWGHLVGDAVGVPYEFGPARPAGSVVFGGFASCPRPLELDLASGPRKARLSLPAAAAAAVQWPARRATLPTAAAR